MPGNDLFTLEEIVGEYRAVLIDASALFNYLDLPLRNHPATSLPKRDSFKREKRSLYEKCSFTSRLRNYIKRGMPIFVTSNVIEEYLHREEHPYKNVLESTLYGRGNETHRILSEKFRLIEKERRELKKMTRTFQENSRILNLNPEQETLYDSLYLGYKWLDEKNGLGVTDFDFLISGAVLAQTNDSAALVSNDFGIVEAWRILSEREGFTSEQLPFFIRKKLFGFLRLG